MAANPVFVGTPRAEIAQVSTANTGRDGTGTIGLVFTAGTSGSRIDKVIINATGTTTAGVVRLWLYNDTNYRLLDEVMVTAITPSATVEIYNKALNYQNFFIPGGSGWYKIAASTHNAETFNVIVLGGDL